jgi:hypothetical protein
MIDLIKEWTLVVRDVWGRLVCADGDSMMVSFAEFSPESDVVNSCRVLSEVCWEMQREMMNGIKFHNLKRISH